VLSPLNPTHALLITVVQAAARLDRVRAGDEWLHVASGVLLRAAVVEVVLVARTTLSEYSSSRRSFVGCLMSIAFASVTPLIAVDHARSSLHDAM